MKKNIPLKLLKAIQPILDNNKGVIKAIKDSDNLIYIKDCDKNSQFYFNVTKQVINNKTPYYEISYFPKSTEQVIHYKSTIEIDGILTHLKIWISIINGYNEIRTIYDDPILLSNQKRFEEQFKILDEDASYASFDVHQQILLDSYLNSINFKLEQLREGKSPEVKEELSELIKESTDLKNELTTSTKKEIIKRLARIWGKAQLMGLEIIKAIFIDISSEVIKKMITGP